jgi:serine phosphatase RsbU (regulator of sigma subunit)
MVEALNDAGEEYGLDRLFEFLRQTQGSSAELKQRLIGSIDAFTAEAPQHDDMTCLIVQFLGNQLTAPR